MKTVDLIEGLTILSKYFDKQDGYNTGAEHDILYVYKTDKPVSEIDLARLTELNWFQPEVDDDAPYDPEEGWGAYT